MVPWFNVGFLKLASNNPTNSKAERLPPWIRPYLLLSTVCYKVEQRRCDAKSIKGLTLLLIFHVLALWFKRPASDGPWWWSVAQTVVAKSSELLTVWRSELECSYGIRANSAYAKYFSHGIKYDVVGEPIEFIEPHTERFRGNRFVLACSKLPRVGNNLANEKR